ncbi:MAG: UDP-glucose 4-epimerase GalE [Desulfovibrio sp.]|nr:UDP-glucose 4-epimerase GalE [Desulfovibrio sp.]
MGQILVTGGAGYIGAHTVKRLAAAGFETVVLDNLSTGHRDFARWGAFIQGDVNDPETLDMVFGSRQVEAVVHFAAASQVGVSVIDPLFYYQNNVQGALTLLAAMRRHKVDTLVFSSTCAVYGPPFDGLLTEEHPVGPISPYAHTKRMIEQILEDCSRAYGLRALCLRYFNAAGADPEAEVGERHQPETHLIPLVLQAALGQRESISIFGDDYPTPDGTAIRDYIHVQDLADAHVLALRHLHAGGASGAFNLGNGLGHSVLQVLEAARLVTGLQIPVRLAPRRAGDSTRLVGDASRARAALGWQPQFADIAEIISTAWNWHRQEPHVPRPF